LIKIHHQYAKFPFNYSSLLVMKDVCCKFSVV